MREGKDVSVNDAAAAQLKLNEIEADSFFNTCSPASLTLDKVAWSPQRNKSLLGPISMTIEPGEFVALVGPNGAGKTSLLRCIYRVNKPTSGHVFIEQSDIWSLSAQQCAQRIATVLQDTNTEFEMTVFEMVEIGLTPTATSWKRNAKDIQAIEHVLALLTVTHLKDRSFNSLSGGERQRVLIARALVQTPDILVLDEPTNHLDIRHQLEILALLAKLPCTIVVSLHDLSLASAYADKVILLNNGLKQDFDAPEHVFIEQTIKQVFNVETIIDQHPITTRPRFSFYINEK